MRAGFSILLLSALTACSDRQPPALPPATALAAPALGGAGHEQGRRIYNFRCYFCHGYSGDGQTLASSYLQPKPRNFLTTSIDQLSVAQMREAVTHGRPGSAMQGFASVLSATEVTAVVDFVRQEFMVDKAVNTHYHTPENGWPEHWQYAAAFPFAKGELPLDTPTETLTPEQRAGRRLFMASCVSCHDRARVTDAGAPWEAQALSYPRNGFVPGQPQQVDTVSGASPYHLHDIAPILVELSAQELRGQTLFQENCAFCHAADGTGRNWIGSFLQPHPRDLTAPAFMRTMTAQRLAGVIREGLPDTSMPAWKSVLSPSQIQALVAYIARAFHPLAPATPAVPAARKKLTETTPISVTTSP
jgi:cytochrome c oxidase cbb3-type subunit 3